MEQTHMNGSEIAVIGMAAQFPGAKNIEEFWDNLINGREAISFFSDEELEQEGIDPQLLKNPNYIKAKGVLEDIQYFDPDFFDYTPAEAGMMDPQFRIFHQCAFDALSHAGYDPYTYKGLIGLYAGIAYNTPWMVQLSAAAKEQHSQLEAGILNDRDFFATRIAYKLHLKGPAITVQTACSTSLTALHLACQALVSGECGIALAGGVSVVLPRKSGYLYREGMLHSATGHCRAFDVHANGTIFGDGAGLVVLKSLEDALEHGDYIYALIKGSAINNDGCDRVGYTAPGTSGQANVIRLAHSVAEVEPETIGYVETHGTGTVLGDPIEMKALEMAFNTTKKGFCAVGSVKTNLGHLNTAAGIAGFIKTVLALKHRKIPPGLHFETPNPGIDFENSPFYVNTRPRDWKSHHYPRRAAVSSFGIGGTNAHVILEEAPAETRAETPREHRLIVLSAKTPSALERMTSNLAEYFKNNPGVNIADAAYTLQMGRKAFKHRRMLVCAALDEAVRALSSPGSGKVHEFVPEQEEINIVFMFPGQGSQYIDMGLGLYQKEPVFREEIDRCFEILNPVTGFDSKEILYPFYRSNRSNRSYKSYKSHINQTEIAQPLLFTIEYALAKLLMRWGIKPYAMIGHSIGEYTAACLAGVFSLEDALKLVVLRGKSMQRMPPGTMLSVALSEQALMPLLKLNKNVSLAAVNSTQLCVVSGPPGDIGAFAAQLKEKGINGKPLHTSHAFHSTMMDPLLAEFEAGVRQVRCNPPAIPYISNITGKWITPGEPVDPGYWSRHLRETVRFNDGITLLLENEHLIFLEVGPGNTLGTFVNRHTRKKPGQPVMSLIRHPREKVRDDEYLAYKIGGLWLYGVSIDGPGFYAGEKRHRVPLPGYPFEKRPYPIETVPRAAPGETAAAAPLPGKNQDMADWFYVTSWERSIPAPARARPLTGKPGFLAFVDANYPGEELVNQLKREGHEVITVKKGPAFTTGEENSYKINPGKESDYEKLFNELCLKGRLPGTILHVWGVGRREPKETGTGLEVVEDVLNPGFYSLIYIARAIAARGFPHHISIEVVTASAREVTGDEVLCPARAAVLGPVKVIPQEYPNLGCRHIDIDIPGTGNMQARLIGRLTAEFLTGGSEPVIAYRNNHRWVQTIKPLRLDETVEKTTPLSQGGVYLITGGLGGIGLVLAEYLASRVGAKLVLTGRSPFPARQHWEEWLTSPGGDPRVGNKIRKLLQIEKTAGEVLVVSADVSNLEQMRRVFTRAEEKFGKINGVIHAAGLTGETMYRAVKDITTADCRRQFKPKIYGTLVLETLLQERDPDFCILMSSTSAILGGLGLAAYSAANSFMDAVSYRHKETAPTRWISVNWDGWRVGEEKKQEQPAFLGQGIVELSMTPAEGVKAFQRILSFAGAGAAQIIQSAGDLQTRLRHWVKREPGNEKDRGPGKKAGTRESRPLLQVPYAAPRPGEEQAMASIWREILGYEQVGVKDHFFEMGGDSLKAVTIVARIHQALDIQLSLQDFFTYPTIAGLAQWIVNSKKSRFSPIKPVEKKEYYVLSSAQQRLYILQGMEEKSTAYNIPQVVRLNGDLDRGRLENTFRRLIQRHESLRTSFHMAAEQPVQRIHHEVEFEMEYDRSLVNYQGRGEVSSPNKVGRIIKNFIRPFDLSRAPLLRVGLIKEKQDNHILIVDMHHIISDGISHNIFVRDFMALYPDNAPDPPQLPIQYKDFSGWQHRQFVSASGKIKEQQDHWLKVFADEPPVLDLPVDYVRPSLQSFAGHTVSFEIGEKETGRLKNLARDEDVTLFMVLLALYNVFLSKLCGSEDIVVGTPAAGRRHADLQPVIGIFVNTLALRNYPAPGKTFTRFLKEVKQSSLAAFDHQDYPYENLLDQAAVTRDTSRNPLFDTMFAMQDTGAPGLEIPGLELTPFPYQRDTSIFDLTLDAFETGGNLAFRFEYCTKLFKEETIQRLVRYFQEIVSSLGKNPGKKIWEIELLPEPEKQELLVEFNNTARNYPKDKTVHGLFAAQAEKTPDHIALVGKQEGEKDKGSRVEAKTGNVSITYKKLNENANRLARLLIEKGVGPDTIVGLMTDSSIEMIIGIFGILKAGGAYLPIDPGYPQERIDYMLKDSGTKILLTAQEIAGLFSPQAFNNRPKGANSINNYQLTINNLQLEQASLAYIIYTSGTTGKPNGVLVTHRNVTDYLFTLIDMFEIGCREVVLQQLSFTFDASVEELYPALIKGGKLVIPGGKIAGNIDMMVFTVKREKVTFISTSPLVLNELNKVEGPGLKSVRLILVGGDALKYEYIDKIVKEKPVYNGYGPTESTVCATFYQCSPSGEGQVPIGKPIGNRAVYILEKNGGLLPIGIAGELCIGGEGLARGYLNHPELTAERFCLDLYRSYRSYRTYIYRTGDLARWRPDGNIEFLGRIDQQVKIRGFRIELGEIESRLLNVPGIKEAVVSAREEESGEKYLCAYFVSVREYGAAELREILAKELPGYMIPSYFVPLAQIPLTPNGKVHRGALPEPGLEVSESYTAPRNEVEKKLVQLWTEVLGRDALHASQLQTSIGMDDNFFHLGGNSLKATVMVSKIHKAFGVPVPLSEIFKRSTIRGIAEYITNTVKERHISIEPVEEREYYECSSAQKRLYIDSLVQTERAAYNLHMVMALQGNLDYEKLENTFLRLIRRHENLRTSFDVVETQVVQRIHRFEDISFAVEHFTKTVEDSIKPFDLSRAPLFRVVLAKEGEKRHILMVDMHHIITDGISLEILARELMDFYDGNELPSLRIQYKDFSQWQNRLFRSKQIEKQKKYWLRVFEGGVPVLNMPTDYQRHQRSFEGRIAAFEIDRRMTTAVRRLVSETGITLHMVLSAVFSILMSKYSGQEDIVVGSGVSGRRHADLENVIGMFVNMISMRNYPKKELSFLEFLEKVKTNALNAYENQDYPFDELVKDLNLQGKPGSNPLFDVVFLTQNVDTPKLRIGELTVKPIESEPGISHFSLVLTAFENPDMISININYCTGLFKTSTAGEIRKNYLEILRQVVKNRDTRIQDIGITTHLLEASTSVLKEKIGNFDFQ